MVSSSHVALLLSFNGLLSHAAPVQQYEAPVVSLSWPAGKYSGAYSAQYNLTYYRKIPFGASTAGNNRFRAPQPPTPITNGIYNTDQSFDMCAQRTVNGSEDCLYLGLYSRPWQQGAKRPVVVTYYGGGFIQGSASFTIPPSGYPVLNASTENDFIFVYPNYRVNAFGFLPGKAVKKSKDADLNVALLDQQAALKWVHDNIENFGGDSKNVSIWGQSAGGGSVVAQVIANGGKTSPKLFTKALASSPFWPKTYKYDDKEAEAIYDSLVNLTGCSNATDTLKCLKEVDVQKIRDANLIISASHTYNTSSYTWAPVIDGDFIQEPLSKATAQGKVNADLIWGMYNSHEGENFTPGGLGQVSGSLGFNNSEAGFDYWLRGYLPDFSNNEIAQVKQLYPTRGKTETLTYNSTSVRAGLIYRDSVLACPSYWIAASASKGWVGEYTISPAKHASDTIYWNQVNSVQQTDPLTYKGYAGAFASFFQTGDPNAHKLTNSSQPGVPPLSQDKEFVITSNGFQNVAIPLLEERCEFWRKHGNDVPV